MRYIVALGNPGDEYKNTRHNFGWLVADFLADKLKINNLEVDNYLEGQLRQGELKNESLIIFYPTTFMNHSGRAVRRLIKKEEISHLVVLHDDIALPFGEIKVSYGRGAGGHNGVESIINHLGTKDFLRIRLGLAPRSFFTGAIKQITGDKYAKFVLGRFSSTENKQIKEVSDKVFQAIELWLTDGKEKVMNQFN